jgi:cytochrome P450
MKTIDLHNPEFVKNPYPFYAQLRASKEPFWVDHQQLNSTSEGMFLFGKYEDVAEILTNNLSLSKKVEAIRKPNTSIKVIDSNMLNQDPPEHTRLRQLVMPSFMPSRFKIYEPRIEAIVDNLISKISDKKDFDFIEAIANPIPVMVIADIMGVPYSDYESFRDWSSDVLTGFDSVIADEKLLLRQKNAFISLINYFNKLIEIKTKNPDESLISSLIEATENQKRLSGEELISMCVLFLVAGHETTVNFIGTGMLTLLNNPDQFELLKKNPQLLNSAVEEMLRFEAPLQRSTFRITKDDCEIAGFKIKKDTQICAVLSSANRDPNKFENPDKFDITRDPNKHLSFGLGIHFCVGAFLARTEAKIAFKKIIERLPNISLSSDEIMWNKATLFRGLKKLDVEIA